MIKSLVKFFSIIFLSFFLFFPKPVYAACDFAPNPGSLSVCYEGTRTPVSHPLYLNCYNGTLRWNATISNLGSTSGTGRYSLGYAGSSGGVGTWDLTLNAGASQSVSQTTTGNYCDEGYFYVNASCSPDSDSTNPEINTPDLPPCGPVCDSTCGAGVCGVKLTNGSCIADWGNATYKLNCCHQACVSNACQYVTGGGSWSCNACQATPTPTPIVVKTKNPYCAGFGFYPYGPYQDKGGNGNTDNLPNTYLKYVSFTAPFTGKVNGLAIKAGNWGGAWRTVFCKVTNNNGTVNISQESDADEFRNDSSGQWRKIAFPTQFTLTGGQQYRLYCRGSDTSNMVYWIYDPTKNTNNDLAKLYGRTYAVCMQ